MKLATKKIRAFSRLGLSLFILKVCLSIAYRSWALEQNQSRDWLRPFYNCLGPPSLSWTTKPVFSSSLQSGVPHTTRPRPCPCPCPRPAPAPPAAETAFPSRSSAALTHFLPAFPATGRIREGSRSTLPGFVVAAVAAVLATVSRAPVAAVPAAFSGHHVRPGTDAGLAGSANGHGPGR